MNSEYNLDKRVSVLEKSMEWAQGSIQNIDRNLEILKNGQFQMLEKLMEYKSDTDMRIGEISEKIASLQAQTAERISLLQTQTVERISSLLAHTDERISSLQAHTDERISSLQAHTDEKFIAVHAEFASVHKEISNIHKAITLQTKWLLAVILAAATLVSVLHPIILKLI